MKHRAYLQQIVTNVNRGLLTPEEALDALVGYMLMAETEETRTFAQALVVVLDKLGV